MKVIDEKPIPIYMVECPECHSKIEYTAAEVSWCHIICPMCKVSLWANTICPVRMEKSSRLFGKIDERRSRPAEGAGNK